VKVKVKCLISCSNKNIMPIINILKYRGESMLTTHYLDTISSINSTTTVQRIHLLRVLVHKHLRLRIIEVNSEAVIVVASIRII